MGQECPCKLEYSGSAYKGKALLETSELVFRGDTRLRIPFQDVARVEATDGQLRVTFGKGEATFHIGPAAAKWAEKILHPPTRLDKLGVKSGARIRWIGPSDKDFKREAEQHGAAFVRTQPHLTFIAASSVQDLAALSGATAPAWVVYPKGVAQIREIDVLNAGRKAGLVDVKVASFSSTHTALKFVPPKTPA